MYHDHFPSTVSFIIILPMDPVMWSWWIVIKETKNRHHNHLIFLHSTNCVLQLILVVKTKYAWFIIGNLASELTTNTIWKCFGDYTKGDLCKRCNLTGEGCNVKAQCTPPWLYKECFMHARVGEISNRPCFDAVRHRGACGQHTLLGESAVGRHLGAQRELHSLQWTLNQKNWILYVAFNLHTCFRFLHPCLKRNI
jgi:hypothetical protein